MVLNLLQDGSINCTELQILPSGSPNDCSSTSSVRCEWSPAIRALSGRAADSISHLGPLGGREKNDQDVELPYRRILGLENTLETDDSQIYESIESMRSFWQEFDAPAEHLLTTTLVPALGENPQETWQNLSQYDLLEDDYRSGASIRRETQAREQLVVDLALSEDVFSPYAVRGPQAPVDVDEAVETMSRAAEAMSIGISEPPPIHFGFLRPVQTRGIDHYDTERSAEGPQQPLGVCLLLQEWNIGEDVASYNYSDPYDSSIPKIPKHSRSSTRAQSGPTDTVAVSHGPPAIATASQPSMFTPYSVIPPIASSQPALVNSRNASFTQPQRGKRLPVGSQPTSFDMSPQASQEVAYPSTQILPGPFGGRPVAKPKATKKKRVGGF
ncbi:hypothetical protein EIP86_007869 [Pleurotus ostreatoroseus]|nr:hypothetical protein EIP86_007869 [Pleurotus ostreatoroseus]